MALLLDEIRLTRDAIHYGFAVGKVRVLSTRLLDASAGERLIDAPSFAEQKRLLSDTPYGRFLESASTPEEVEAALDAALDSAYRFLDEAALPAAVTRFFRVRADFRNLKGALKAAALGAPLDGLLAEHGTIDTAAFSGELTELPEPLGALAAELQSAEGLDPAAIDTAVDAALFAELKRLAREAKSAYLGQIASLMVDLANVKTMVRSRLAGLDAEQTAALLLDGGSVERVRLTTLLELAPADLAGALERIEALKGIDAEGLLSADTLDPVTDAVLLRLLARGRRGPEGPEPVIAYVFARENEVATLRVLLLGRLAGIDNDTLRARLRTGLR